MAAVVADTHAILWYLLSSERLSQPALGALDAAVEKEAPIFVASISVVEVVYLVEKNRLPEVALRRLVEALTDRDTAMEVASLDLHVARRLSEVPRDAVPDMPDRIIAATAVSLDLPLVTRDSKIRASPVRTIW